MIYKCFTQVNDVIELRLSRHANNFFVPSENVQQNPECYKHICSLIFICTYTLVHVFLEDWMSKCFIITIHRQVPAKRMYQN